MINNKPEVLNLLEKLQNFTPNEVDEERGSFKIGDSVIYDMLGGALSNSDLIKTLGIKEHTLRISHNGAVAKITETAGEEVSRYNIAFEDGFIIKDVAASELKSVIDEMRPSATKIAQELFSKQIGELTVEEKAEVKQVMADQMLKSNLPTQPGAKVDEAGGGLTAKDVATSELKASEPSGSQPKPQEEPDLDAEELHLEDYSKDDLEKVKSKSAKTGDAIRKVEDDELKIAPDKVKKESKLHEEQSESLIKQVVDGLEESKVEEDVDYGDYSNEKLKKLVRDAKDKNDPNLSAYTAELRKRGVSYTEMYAVEKSKVKEETEFTPSRAEFKKIGDEKLKQLLKNARNSHAHWKKDRTEPEKAKAAAEAVTRYEEEMVNRGLMSSPSSEKKEKKILEYFPVQELSSDFDEMFSQRNIEDLGQELCGKAKKALVTIRNYAKLNNITKDMDMPLPEEVGKWIGPIWDESYAWEDLAKGDSSTMVQALEDIVKYAEKLRESKFSFMQKQEPLWLCNECHKTFRSGKAICALCESKEVEKILEQAKEVFQVTWKNTDTNKEESTRVMAYDKTDAKREAKRSNREIIKVEGPITSESKEEDKAPFDQGSEGSKIEEDTKPYTITWQNLDEPHGKFRFFDVNAHSKEHARAKAIDTLKRDGIPEKFIEIKAVELKEAEEKQYSSLKAGEKTRSADVVSCPRCVSRDTWNVEDDIFECNECGARWDEDTGEVLKEREQKVIEDDPITAIEIVTSKVDPDAYNIRVVQLPEGEIVILDSVSDREVAIERGKKFAQDLNAKFLGIIDENKVEEQEEDTFKTIAKGIADKETADKLAVEKEGQVVVDDEDDKKFAVLVREE